MRQKKLTIGTIPWNERRRLEILNRPRLENAHFSLGSEYFLKGIFLKKGFAINKTVKDSGVNHPIKVRGNRSYLLENEVVQMNTIVKYLPSIIDLSGFDIEQQSAKKAERYELGGERLKGINNLGIPHPNSVELLDYLLFKRNYALHRPFIIPEFKGITHQLFRFLNYISVAETGLEIMDLADFNCISKK